MNEIISLLIEASTESFDLHHNGFISVFGCPGSDFTPLENTKF